jgi:hypothetical protein
MFLFLATTLFVATGSHLNLCLSSRLGEEQIKQPLVCKFWVVGATGFEPVTSTV